MKRDCKNDIRNPKKIATAHSTQPINIKVWQSKMLALLMKYNTFVDLKPSTLPK